MRDRLKLLAGQVEGVAWSDGQIKAKWLLERLQSIQGDVDSVTWEVLAYNDRLPNGRFRSRG